MSINERIRFFRKLRGLTRRRLGTKVEFPEKSAETRIAQYELGIRTPRPELTEAFAAALDISPQALTVPDIDSITGIAHTFFALEDIYGLTVERDNGRVCLRPNILKNLRAVEMNRFLGEWCRMADKLKNGEISQEDYDQWRYNYAGLTIHEDEETGYGDV